jgi:hypothetical protein
MVPSYNPDEGETDVWENSTLKKDLDALIKMHIDGKIRAIAEEHLLPKVTNYIENFCVQKTNEWGEKRGGSMSFTEYLISRAEAYIQEKVSHEGKSKEEGGFGWNATQTRLAHLINQNLHYNIQTAMKEILTQANQQLVNGIAETVKTKLHEIVAQLKVSVGR